MQNAQDIANSAPQRILACDDDPIMREMMKARLGDNVDVTCAENGQIAWEKLLEQDFDLAIIDLGMPELDGFGLIKYLRQTPKTVDLPIIVATSRSDQQAIEEAFTSGASGFVTKPINWSLFHYQVQFVLKHGKIEKQLRAGNAASDLLIRTKDNLLNLMSDVLVHQQISGDTDKTKYDMSDAITLTKLMSNELKPSFCQNDVNIIIAEAVRTCQQEAANKTVKVVARQSLANVMINVDTGIWLNALKRLVFQGVKASPAGGTVEIMLGGQRDGSMVISVRDNGPQKTQAEIDRKINILINNSSPNNSDKLTIPDLNLPIVKRSAEIHGGRAIFQNNPGQGNISALWLPASKVHIQELVQTA